MDQQIYTPVKQRADEGAACDPDVTPDCGPFLRWIRSGINVALVTSGAIVAVLTVAIVLHIASLHRRGGCQSSIKELLKPRIKIFGYECDSAPLYAVVLLFSLALQILRSCLWAKESQCKRDALKTRRRSRTRAQYVGYVVIYTFVGFLLYIISLLFVMSQNIGLLAVLLVGAVAGNAIAFTMQPPDRFAFSKPPQKEVEDLQSLRQRIAALEQALPGLRLP